MLVSEVCENVREGVSMKTVPFCKCVFEWGGGVYKATHSSQTTWS